MNADVPAPARRPMPPEQEITVPFRPVLIATAIATVFSVAGIVLLSSQTADPREMALVAGLGAAAAGVVSAGSARLFASEKPRPASLVGSLWLGATLIRFVLVPALCLSVYFAAPKVAFAAVLATCGSYLACLAAETAVVVRLVNRGSSAHPPSTP